MFLPIGDSPNLPKTPWLNYFLIAANVVVHLVLLPLSGQLADPNDPVTHEYQQVLIEQAASEGRSVGLGQTPRLTQGDIFRYRWGFRPAEMSWLTALTSMFLHGGFAHLLGNMLFLWIFGDNIEHRLGRLGYAIAYLSTGFLAAFGDALLRWGSSIPSVGASGAISGVLGLYFVFFPHNRVRVFVFLFPFLMNVVEISAKWVLAAYVVLNNLLPLLLTAGSGGVSYGAHLGGFLAGWILGRQLSTVRAPLGPETERPDLGGGLQADFRNALWNGRLDIAAAHLFKLPRSVTVKGLSAADKTALGDALANGGRYRAALAAYQRALGDHPVAGERPAAHLGAAKVLLHAFREPTAAYQHLYAVMEEEPTAAEAAEAKALLKHLRTQIRAVPKNMP